jgi:hypothetical protein
MGEWGNGKMGKWENGEMGEWGNGKMGEWGNGEMGEWGNGEMGEWENGKVGPAINTRGTFRNQKSNSPEKQSFSGLYFFHQSSDISHQPCLKGYSPTICALNLSRSEL